MDRYAQQVVDAAWDERMSKSNSQVETHLSPESPQIPPLNNENLPQIPNSQAPGSYREIKPREFVNSQL